MLRARYVDEKRAKSRTYLVLMNGILISKTPIPGELLFVVQITVGVTQDEVFELLYAEMAYTLSSAMRHFMRTERRNILISNLSTDLIASTPGEIYDLY